jgi:hypothetical protein
MSTTKQVCPKCGCPRIGEARIDGALVYLCLNLSCDYAWWEDGEPCQMQEAES